MRQIEELSGTLGVAINQEEKCQPLVSIGVSIPALQKELVDKIRANEYVDFAELPPAKGKGRPVPQSVEGQIIVVQVANLMHIHKIIPNLATWCQCFAVYVAALIPPPPAIQTSRLHGLSLIARASQKYKWPSWVVYDQATPPRHGPKLTQASMLNASQGRP